MHRGCLYSHVPCICNFHAKVTANEPAICAHRPRGAPHLALAFKETHYGALPGITPLTRYSLSPQAPKSPPLHGPPTSLLLLKKPTTELVMLGLAKTLTCSMLPAGRVGRSQAGWRHGHSHQGCSGPASAKPSLECASVRELTSAKGSIPDHGILCLRPAARALLPDGRLLAPSSPGRTSPAHLPLLVAPPWPCAHTKAHLP